MKIKKVVATMYILMDKYRTPKPLNVYLHPRDAFAKNIGHDSSGVHCGKTSCYDTSLSYEYNIEWPTTIEEHPLARQRHIEYFNSLKVPFWKRMVNKIMRILSKEE